VAEVVLKFGVVGQGLQQVLVERRQVLDRRVGVELPEETAIVGIERPLMGEVPALVALDYVGMGPLESVDVVCIAGIMPRDQLPVRVRRVRLQIMRVNDQPVEKGTYRMRGCRARC